MAITGVCLVLFVTFHVLMNSVALLWPAAYNQICMFLGANWYALVASIGLAALFIIHIIYAVWLTIQNRKARGTDNYAVESRPKQVEWSSKNMLVLGIVILAFLVVHLMQFWYKMQYQEIIGSHASIDGTVAPAEFGTLFLQAAFAEVWTPIVYIIGFVALWFHMTHGFWSMFQSIGWNNTVWFNRLKCISCWWTSIVVLLFVAQAVLFTVQAHNKFFLTEPQLQEQYAEYWGGKADEVITDFQTSMQKQHADLVGQAGMDQFRYQQAMESFLREEGAKVLSKLEVINKAVALQCPDAVNTSLSQAKSLGEELAAQLGAAPQEAAPAAFEEEEAVEDILIEEIAPEAVNTNN